MFPPDGRDSSVAILAVWRGGARAGRSVVAADHAGDGGSGDGGDAPAEDDEHLLEVEHPVAPCATRRGRRLGIGLAEIEHGDDVERQPFIKRGADYRLLHRKRPRWTPPKNVRMHRYASARKVSTPQPNRALVQEVLIILRLPLLDN